MKCIYNEEYYSNYDIGTEAVNYKESEYTKGFLEKIAQYIARDLQPRTVLDAGCAMGHLVAALRDLGVEAYGIDISEYAISMVREDIRPFCYVGSLTEPLPVQMPQKFDLVVTVEVLEHLLADDGRQAIAHLCTYADQILFSSTPDDFEDPTHCNVQPREYWAKLFAENDFFDDLSYRPTYLTEYASCFKKGNNWLSQLEEYERYIQKTDKLLKEGDPRLAKIIEDKERHIQNLSVMLEDQKQEIQKLNQELALVVNSRSWRLTKPLRAVIQKIREHKYLFLIAKGVKSLVKNGPRATWWKVKRRLKNRNMVVKAVYTEEDLEAQRCAKFPLEVKFSILVPLYNTPELYLKEMIRSVLDQTYANWELCLADGSDGEHSFVGEICKELAAKDSRICYQKLEKNMGISGNTNACIDMSTGDYIALFDHDDLLHPAALYEMMKAICEQGADMVYTDENTFHRTPSDAFCPAFKPDFAPDTLRSYNYICHFTAFSRELLEKAGGGFRSRFDGSQDYDMILRLTEQAEKIVHIPIILYYWRSHPGSVASDISAKSYALDAAKGALQEHMARVGLKGKVLDSRVPSTYRIQYEIEGEPLISILIPNKDHIDDLKKCLDSVKEKSTYTNWEIIVIENNSTEERTFEYYRQIQLDPRFKVVTWSGEFNYSAINNYGVQYAKGDYILLLNNDIEVITPDWLEQMLMFAQRADVGAVGAMLYYPDNTIQHAGVIVGLGGVAGHSHKYTPKGDPGYMNRLTIAQNYSCVTAACLLTSRKVWEAVGGLDENFKVAFNDVDLCMRIRKAGYLIAWTPYAEMYHHESKSRGGEDTPEKQKRFEGEIQRFRTRWARELEAGDPYYNPNLTLDREDFSKR